MHSSMISITTLLLMTGILIRMMASTMMMNTTITLKMKPDIMTMNIMTTMQTWDTVIIRDVYEDSTVLM